MRRLVLLVVVFLVPLMVLAGPADESAKGPDTFATGPAARATGGPDDFGYSFIDSTEAGGPVYGWEDISGTGTVAYAGYLDDGVLGSFPIGFTFNFYGTDYSQFWVQTNGSIGFADFSYDYGNGCLPRAQLNDRFLAPLWDDLVCGSSSAGGGTIYYQTMGTAPNRYLVVQFQGFRYIAGDSADRIDFEVILYEGSNDIVYQYADLTNGTSSHNGGMSATIGIQGDSGASPVHYLQYACNPGTELTVPLAVLFTPGAPPTPLATPVPGIPTVTPWGLAALLLTIAGVAVLLLRRRG